MPDETTNTENTEQVSDSTQSSEDKSTVQTESEFMDETIKDIKQTQKTILNQDETKPTEGTPSSLDETETPEGQQGRPDLAGVEIPSAFSSVAEELGMTPSEIVAIADNRTDGQLLNTVSFIQVAGELGMTSKEAVDMINKHTDAELLEMASFLKESVGVDDAADEDESVDEEHKETNTEDDNKDATQKLIDQAAEKIKAELGVSLEDINKFKEQQAAQEDKQTLETANRKLDEAAKEFSIFGDTEKLPRFTTGRLKGQFIPTSPAFKARMEVLKYADAFIGMGNSVDDAMDLALSTYKGMNLRTEMERSLVKDLKQHEQNLSGVRTGKETKKKFADSREEIIDDIRGLQRKAGVEV